MNQQAEAGGPIKTTNSLNLLNSNNRTTDDSLRASKALPSSGASQGPVNTLPSAGGSLQHQSAKATNLANQGGSRHGHRSGPGMTQAAVQSSTEMGRQQVNQTQSSAQGPTPPVGNRQSQTGGGMSSQHSASFNNQQSSILMNSGGLAMQNLTQGISNSESKKISQISNMSAQGQQKHSMSGLTMISNDNQGSAGLHNREKYMKSSQQLGSANAYGRYQNGVPATSQQQYTDPKKGKGTLMQSKEVEKEMNRLMSGGTAGGNLNSQMMQDPNYAQNNSSNMSPSKRDFQTHAQFQNQFVGNMSVGTNARNRGSQQVLQNINGQPKGPAMMQPKNGPMMQHTSNGIYQDTQQSQTAIMQQQQQQQQEQMMNGTGQSQMTNGNNRRGVPMMTQSEKNGSKMRPANTKSLNNGQTLWGKQNQIQQSYVNMQNQKMGTKTGQQNYTQGSNQQNRVYGFHQQNMRQPGSQSQGVNRTAGQMNFNQGGNASRKRVENLPRTGIEYPMMKELGHAPFISAQKEFEPLSETTLSPTLLEEYQKNDADRSNLCPPGTTFPVVYDYIEQSPYYEGENSKFGPYIDEKDLIELPNPTDQQNGQINEPYQKRYFFNPQNLPYSLEQSHQYGQAPSGGTGPTSIVAQKRNGTGGPRLNRYYEKLKPYYRVDQDKLEELHQGANRESLPADKTLVFESRFESGNLRKVMKMAPFDYELYLKNDYSTQSYCQWYYFRIQNTRKDQVYRFNIVNMMKPDSTYNKGMRPLVYSLKDAEENKMGWQRDCFNIGYFQTGRPKKAFKNQNSSQFRGNLNFCPSAILNANNTTVQPSNDGYGSMYYSLTFEFRAKYDMDTVYFAHCYPYTYTDLTKFVSKTCTYQNKDKVRKTVLCKSLAGNDVDMLIVTNFASIPEDIAVRKAIILTARVHPGESNASWMMQGVIDFLVGDDEKAQYLRDTYVLKIIPMLNPDGVIVGNYRCSLVGQDLNRQWIGSSPKLYPINYHTKLMMKKTQESREIFFFCDFHGHSVGRNVFMYGNQQMSQQHRLKEKIFPMMFQENNDNFNFDDCSFIVHKSKESCSRIVMWREFNLVYSYTCEASFCGPTRGIHNNCHFNVMLYEIIGRVFCKTLVDMTDNKERVRRIVQDLQLRYPVNAPVKKGYAADDEEEEE